MTFYKGYTYIIIYGCSKDVICMINDRFNKVISIKELDKLSKDKYILIDIREKYKYKLGHMPNAISMTEKEIIANIEKLKNYDKIIVYCDYGNSGLKLVMKLADEYNIDNIYNIVGGYNVYRGRIIRE